MLAYGATGQPLEMELEVDNELDVVGVIATREEVRTSEELEGPDDWRDFVRRFRERASESPRVLNRVNEP